MIPHVKNVLLASADSVAIDAVAAQLMGFEPLSIKYIRLAHERGLGCGDPRKIDIVSDVEAAQQKIVDVVRRPQYYGDIVRRIRRHLSEQHSHRARLQRLIEIIES